MTTYLLIVFFALLTRARSLSHSLTSSLPHSLTLSLKARSSHGRAGLTLVELLITTALMAFIGAVTVAALSGGVGVWERAAAYGTQQESSNLAFDRVRRDLRNATIFTPVPFTGAYDQCSFARVDHEPSSGDSVLELGRVGYFLDERHHLLCRSFVPYRLMKRYRVTERCEPILEGVMRLRFRYYGAEDPAGTPAWTEHWSSPRPPLALQADCQVAAGNARQTATRTVVIALPARPLPTTEAGASARAGIAEGRADGRSPRPPSPAGSSPAP